MSSCGLKASEGQRFNRKWRKERGAGHSILKNMETASEAAGQTPPMVLTAAAECAGFAARVFPYRFHMACICVAARFYKVVFCCVVNWIPGVGFPFF